MIVLCGPNLRFELTLLMSQNDYDSKPPVCLTSRMLETH